MLHVGGFYVVIMLGIFVGDILFLNVIFLSLLIKGRLLFGLLS